MIAEYCVKGKVEELPIRNLQILPFNFDHALRAGKLASITFSHKDSLLPKDRKIISNDTKLFAQADCEENVEGYVTSDSESKKIYDLLEKHTPLSFKFIDLHVKVNESFGFLPL